MRKNTFYGSLVLLILLAVGIHGQQSEEIEWRDVFVGGANINRGRGARISINFNPIAKVPAVVPLKPGDVLTLKDITYGEREGNPSAPYVDYRYTEGDFVWVDRFPLQGSYLVNDVPYAREILSTKDLVSHDDVTYVSFSLSAMREEKQYQDLYLGIEEVKRIGAGFPKLRIVRLEYWNDKTKLEYLKLIPRIEILDLWVSSIVRDDLKYLPELPHLQMLNFDTANISNEDLRHLQNFPQLEVLNFSNTDIGDEGLAYLQSLKNLRVLGLNDTQVIDEGVKYIANLPNLQELYLREVRPTFPRKKRNISDSNLLHLTKLKHLHTLYIEGIGEKGYMEVIGELTNLVNLSAPGSLDTNIKHLQNLRKLRVLDTWISTTQLCYLKELKELRFLRVDDITDPGLKDLKNFPELRVVTVDDPSKITDEILSCFRDLPKLMALDLTRSKITDDGLSYLESWPNLQILKLRGTNISDAGLKHLSKVSNLRMLDLGYTKITESGMPYLSHLTRLKELYLDNNPIGDKALAHLANLRELRLLNLADACFPTIKVRESCRKLFPSCKIAYEPGGLYSETDD